ncbi:MAG: hypothetical protein ABWZ74_04495 [Hyphomicrobiaceae bacterium]
MRAPRRTATFKQIDVVRAMKAAKKAAFPIAAVRITKDGDIVVIPGNPESMPPSPPVNEWDDK